MRYFSQPKIFIYIELRKNKVTAAIGQALQLKKPLQVTPIK